LNIRARGGAEIFITMQDRYQTKNDERSRISGGMNLLCLDAAGCQLCLRQNMNNKE
jgi:hypothetical protein